MKKNKIVMSVVSGLLVAAVAVGGTLAYLSDTSNQVTNTFNVGSGYVPDEDDHVGLWLDETKVTNPLQTEPVQDDGQSENGEERFDDEGTQTYPDLMPGTQFAKDPTFHLTEGSVDSYVVAKVDGVDKAMNPGSYIFKDSNKEAGFNNTWMKVANANGDIIGGDGAKQDDGKKDGYYLYVEAGTATAKVVSGGDTTDDIFTYVQLASNVTDLKNSNGLSVTIKGAAVQHANVDQATAIAEAVNVLK